MYISINGTTYRTRYTSGTARGITGQQRRRALNFSLLVDDIAGGDAAVSEKEEVSVEFIGSVSGGSTVLFTIATAKVLRGVLLGGNVAVAGDVGSFTARAKDVKEADVVYGGGVARAVTATLEEV